MTTVAVVSGPPGVSAVQPKRAASRQDDVDVRAAELDHQLQKVPQDQHGILPYEVTERRAPSCRGLGEFLKIFFAEKFGEYFGDFCSSCFCKKFVRNIVFC
jgi:hypothetical protein